MENKATNAAEFLWALAQQEMRCAALPAELRPKSRAEAYAAQASIEKHSKVPLAGWKIAATSLNGQKHIGVSGPLAGRYIAERVAKPGATIPFGKNHMKVAEVEFAFKLGKALPPRKRPYSEDEVLASIASCHPAIELPDSRFDHFEIVGAEALIADNACAHWLIVGEAMPETWRKMNLADFAPTGQVNEKPKVMGKGANVLGSPMIAITWLVNELSSLGVSMQAGEVATTGTCLVPMPIAAGDRVVADYGDLGWIDVSLG